MKPIAHRRLAGAAVLALAAAPAHAHLVQTGFGDFYDGIVHLAVTPEDILLVAALALFAGLRGTQAARHTVLALALAWLAGGMIGVIWPFTSPLTLLTTLSFALAGALVALNASLHPRAVTALAIAAGLLHGLVNGAAMALGEASHLALVGVVSAIFVLTTVIAAQVAALPEGWPRIVVRVGGSWIAATGLLMFGWIARAAT